MYYCIHVHKNYVMVFQKDSIRYRDVRYKDQPLPPNSKQIVTSSVNLSSTTPSGSLSSQTTSTSAQPSKPLSAQHTALSQPTLSSHSALSYQPDLSSQQALPTTTMFEQITTTSTLHKSEVPDALEQAKKCEPQAPALSATAEPESELSQPHSTSEKAKNSQPSTIVHSESGQPSSKSAQAEDKSLTNAPSSLPSQPPPSAQNSEKYQITPPIHAHSSTANTDSSIQQSGSSTQPSETSVAKVPLLSSQTPIESPASAQTSQTSQPSSDLTKSRQPLQLPHPSISESQSTLDAKDLHTALSKPPRGSKEGTPVDKAPPTDAEAGVAVTEPVQISQDSLTGLKKEESDSMTTGDRGTGKDRDSSLAEEELLRLMHPSIVAGKKLPDANTQHMYHVRKCTY